MMFPILLGENVTLHVPELAVHWPEAGVNVPDPAGEAVNVTVPPVGVTSFPIEKSVTVAVHAVLPVTRRLEEEHDTLTDEFRLVTASVKFAKLPV